MISTMYDSKATKTLFDTYWTPKGWREPPSTPPADLAYATSEGVMFPPALLPHDSTLERLREVCEKIPPTNVGRAFLASLSTRELALRSALGSFSVARYVLPHAFVLNVHSGACNQCGLHLNPTNAQAEDLSVLNFERLKWGGVRHVTIPYQLLDLEEFLKLNVPQPTDDDVKIFAEILRCVQALPSNSTVTHVVKLLRTILSGNTAEYRTLIEVLCLCGVLSYPGYHHYFDDTDPPKGRPYRDTDWGVPAMYWRASDGYRIEHLQEYFPEYLSRLIVCS
jgi:hypothetical protein